MTNAASHLRMRLVHWSELHAAILLAGTALVVAGASQWSLMLAAAVSFTTLAVTCRPHWTARGRFGAANALTMARVLGVLTLPALAGISPLSVVIAAITLLALDGVDGWLARRLGLASEFGEYLDKEADAFLMLVLCLLLYSGGRLGPWILVPGVLRYGFVVFLMLARPPAVKERRSAMGRWIYLGMISALIAGFTPFPAFYRPYALLMTLALLYSFAQALMDVHATPREDGSA